jgi:hypothetical protein
MGHPGLWSVERGELLKSRCYNRVGDDPADLMRVLRRGETRRIRKMPEEERAA